MARGAIVTVDRRPPLDLGAIGVGIDHRRTRGERECHSCGQRRVRPSQRGRPPHDHPHGPQLPDVARCGPEYSSNSLNVHTLPPAGTLARLGSPERMTYGPVAPLVIVPYCLPSRSQVIGWPTMPADVWNSHRVFPVSASTAMNSPVSRPVKTRPPAVTSVPEKFGLLKGTAHFDRPVTGSRARRWPRPSGSSKI